MGQISHLVMGPGLMWTYTTLAKNQILFTQTKFILFWRLHKFWRADSLGNHTQFLPSAEYWGTDVRRWVVTQHGKEVAIKSWGNKGKGEGGRLLFIHKEFKGSLGREGMKMRFSSRRYLSCFEPPIYSKVLSSDMALQGVRTSPEDQWHTPILKPSLALMFPSEKWNPEAVRWVTGAGFRPCSESTSLTLSVFKMGLIIPHSRVLRRGDESMLHHIHSPKFL